MPDSDLPGGPDLDRFLKRADELLSEDEPQPAAPAPGFRISGYRLIHRLGHGGMGVVWLAEDEALGRRVALKLLPPHMTFDPEAVWRFRQEASATAGLAHPNIVTVFAAGEEEGQRYLAMEYVEGVPVDRLLARLVGRRPGDTALRDVAALLALECPAMSGTTAALRAEGGSYVRTVADWVAQAADALAHAHSKGVLHRDMKPSNLLLDTRGRVRVVDFGLAQMEEAAPITRTGAILGTLTYMAPEALLGQRGRADSRADIYGLGAVLYELLAFQPPFLSDSLHALVQDVHTAEPPPLPTLHRGVPRDLVWIAGKCLAKEPERRYATAADLADDLRRFLEGRPVRARPVGPLRRLKYWARRRPVRALLLGLVLAAAAVAWPAARFAEHARTAREAEEERRLAAAKLDEHRRGREALATERAEFLLRSSSGDVVAGEDGVAGRARWERRLFEMEIGLARALEDARGALDRAARLEGEMSDATSDAFDEHYLYRYDLAEEHNDTVLLEVWRGALLANDRGGRSAAKLFGAVPLEVHVAPAGAEAFLFRFEPYESYRPEGTPRLVPVPTAGRGRCRPGPWIDTFCPGDLCLVVTAVEPGSVAAANGLEPDDLVLRINDTPSSHVFVTAVQPGMQGERAAIRPWDPVRDVGGRDVRNERAWRELARTPLGNEVFVRIGQQGFVVSGTGTLGDRLGIDVAGPERILGFPAPQGGARLVALHRGEWREIRVAEGRVAGVTCEATAYPLILSSENAIPCETRIDVTPGSYLVYARGPGLEAQRFPVRVARERPLSVRLQLQATGSTPEGFVWIPPGPMLVEADTAWSPARLCEIDVPGFHIMRTEVTIGEWFEFLNQPEALEAIKKAKEAGRTIYLPRHYNAPYVYAKWSRDKDRYEPDDAPDVPVYGISGADVKDFLLWRNERATARGDAWLWAIPTGPQWAKAARGADGRLFPWGSRFDGTLLAMGPSFAKDRPCRSEPKDESPYGVADMGGSRREWVEKGMVLRGGSWGQDAALAYRASSEEWTGDGYFNHTCGFRPVLVPRVPAR